MMDPCEECDGRRFYECLCTPGDDYCPAQPHPVTGALVHPCSGCGGEEPAMDECQCNAPGGYCVCGPGAPSIWER